MEVEAGEDRGELESSGTRALAGRPSRLPFENEISVEGR